MKFITKLVLFLLTFVVVIQASIPLLKSSYDLSPSEYGVRYYDPRTSVWQSPDPILNEYMNGKTNGGVFNPKNLSLFTYTYNNPISLVDPDGERVYFVAGAGNDSIGWNYTNRWQKAFSEAGIKDFVKVNASMGHTGDILYTATNRSVETTKGVDALRSTIVAQAYKDNIKTNPLGEGEQLNMVGYSYGSVMQAQAAQKLAKNGVAIDNLVLVGSPISSDSELYKQLSANKNIKNIIRIDIEGDKLSNPKSFSEFVKGGFQNMDVENGPHFDLARPGTKTDQRIQEAVNMIKRQGVEN